MWGKGNSSSNLTPHGPSLANQQSEAVKFVDMASKTAVSNPPGRGPVQVHGAFVTCLRRGYNLIPVLFIVWDWTIFYFEKQLDFLRYDSLVRKLLIKLHTSTQWLHAYSWYRWSKRQYECRASEMKKYLKQVQGFAWLGKELDFNMPPFFSVATLQLWVWMNLKNKWLFRPDWRSQCEGRFGQCNPILISNLELVNIS